MEPYNPVSTYRLQFNGDFTLKDAERILGYLGKLGIRTLYASPVFQAVSGSKHGYDVTDPLSLNQEIGSDRMFERLTGKVHGRGMGWLQDFVPNHMAYSTENPWIYDLLVHGKDSEYHGVFDIVPGHPDRALKDRLMLPFFGKPAERLIRDHELTLRFGEQGFSLVYYDSEYPVSRQAYPLIIGTGAGIDPSGGNDQSAKPGDQSDKSGDLPGKAGDLLEKFRDISEGHAAAGDWQKKIRQLFRNYSADPELAGYIDHCTEVINRDPARMRSLVDKLGYLPVHWKETEKRINYRRFFTINGLICVNTHLDDVFDLTHGLIKSWVDQGMVNGLRVDHVDGLYDPSGYLVDLRRLCGNNTYIVVEKILEKEESLPASWPVQGSTGYDFLALVNNLLTNSANSRYFYAYYREWTAISKDPEQFFQEKKRWILYHRFGGELELLTHECMSTCALQQTRVSRNNIREAIAEFMVHFPVYRYYHAPSGFTKTERNAVREIIERALEYNPGIVEALKRLQCMFLLKDTEDEKQIMKIDRFFRRIMQFTGPLMAKGLEDTAFYAFNPFIAHNEVGDSPGYFGIDADAFHRQLMLRREKFPLTLNTLSTHDTKRGEDARARLNVLSDLPDRWKKVTGTWRRLNHGFKQTTREKETPAAADEYLIYQALCAHVPMNGCLNDSFADRFRDYLVKALREAKERTSWSNPDKDYEQHTLEFVNKILEPEHGFLESLQGFLELIIPHGIINSMTQTILKNTVPGVPDTFQGSETWNLSFVDPDNRRPVDYNSLSKQLGKMIRSSGKGPLLHLEELWEHAEDGRIKQWVSYLTLQERSKNPYLFLKGSYVPLRVTGRDKSHILAFYRSCRDEHLIVAVPLNTASMPDGHGWKDTRIKLPDLAPLKWENRMTREILTPDGYFQVSKLFQKVPFAILGGIPNKPEKRAGILMHVSSLPGEFGAGDFGPPACRFIDFLQRSGQRYWQILPLSAISPRTSHSPYSSRSAFAGNTLFIDPHQLVETGLLDGSELNKYRQSESDRADYPEAEKAKNHFLEKAWRAFQKSGQSSMRNRYDAFLEQEQYWLNDYALFEALKQHYSERAWYEWPAKYRDRDKQTLEEFQRRHREKVERIIFGQFIFIEQWNRLKAYANDRGVDIFGDVPIYIDHDSADAWAHPEIFRLNRDKSMESVAGVPPDYFNREGQLWGMPLYNWESMETDKYRWWLQRIEKNLQWFDLLRLDHFRGFSAYWEVPADAGVALKGKWSHGPKTKLFDAIKDRYPDMPFVAEDLGQIDREVYDLRDRYRLPGMKVVQFGFGRRMAFSHHYPGNIPYNSIVYTGTHDNNTMKGWYRQEADRATLKRFRDFAGKELTEKNVHEEMIRIAYASPARLAIIPMQDWLGLNENSRMNFPSTNKGNWMWRVRKDSLDGRLEKKIRKKVRLFGRY